MTRMGDMARIGFYPGSFDPVTYGHLDIITRAGRLVDVLVVAVGQHHAKPGLLSVEERLRVLEEALRPIREHAECEIKLAKYTVLTVEAAKRAGASVIIRGLRDGSDFDYEVRMAQTNATLEPNIETIFLAASPSARMISSTLIRQIAEMGGDIGQFVPMEAAEAVMRAIGAKKSSSGLRNDME